MLRNSTLHVCFLNWSPKPGILCVVTREDKLDENKSLLSIYSLKKEKNDFLCTTPKTVTIVMFLVIFIPNLFKKYYFS